MRLFVLIFSLLLASVTKAHYTSTSPSPSPQTGSSARISIRKCNEYKEFAYDKHFIYGPIAGLMERKISNCAPKSAALVLNGTPAAPREFPHMALIGFVDKKWVIHWLCGGTLISERFVLSAAHCSEDDEIGSAKYVRLGAHRIYGNNYFDAPENFTIIERISHPEYRKTDHYNDIVLFKLDRKVRFDGSIRAACLPDQSTLPKKAIATGWGQLGLFSGSSNVLMKVDLDIFSQDKCLNTSISQKMREGIVEDTQICAGSNGNEKKDTCQGDSGGPLQIVHELHHCTFIVIGVTSIGLPCDLTESPGIYTRVYGYLDWIERNVWPNE